MPVIIKWKNQFKQFNDLVFRFWASPSMQWKMESQDKRSIWCPMMSTSLTGVSVSFMIFMQHRSKLFCPVISFISKLDMLDSLEWLCCCSSSRFKVGIFEFIEFSYFWAFFGNYISEIFSLCALKKAFKSSKKSVLFFSF